jgi:hypothetical protein
LAHKYLFPLSFVDHALKMTTLCDVIQYSNETKSCTLRLITSKKTSPA